MKTEECQISILKFADYNPRKLSVEQEASLKQSLSSFGFVEPIIVNSNPKRKNVIIGGHQRVRVWSSLGNTTVPVVFVDLDKARERELNIRLNKNTGEWDWTLLEDFFTKDELKGWGFSDADLHGRFKAQTKGDDDAPLLPIKAKTKPGDRYEMNGHVLLCGDSTLPQDMEKLMAGQKAELVFTDPPYNVNYSGQGKNTKRKIQNDNLAQEDFRKFLSEAFKRIFENAAPGSAFYCCYASRTHREFEDSINAAGYEVRNQIIWVKTVAAMGWGDYRWKHEPMLYCVKSGKRIAFNAGHKEVTAWDELPSDDELLEIFKKMIKQEEDGGSTVWRFSRESNYVHPTQKPVALCSRAILNSSRLHSIVLDTFGGSGSTLIAAEKNDRIARIMEKDPSFCDVIVQRYVDFMQKNGKKVAVYLNGKDVSSDFCTQNAGKMQGKHHE